MISEKELQKAIRECESEPITASKVGKLADFYIIYDHLFGEPLETKHSNMQERTEKIIETNGKSDFLCSVNGKKSEKVWSVINELVDAVKVLHPQMYDKFLDKILDL